MRARADTTTARTLAKSARGAMTLGQLATEGGSAHQPDAHGGCENAAHSSEQPSSVSELVGPAAGAKRRDVASTASGGAMTKNVRRAKPPKPACISALRLDAGTSFVLPTDPELWRRELRQLFDQGRPGKGIVVADTAPMKYAESKLAASGLLLSLHFRHTAYVILDARSGRIEVQAKAEALWALGIEAWCAEWLGWLSWAAGATPCTIHTARSMGWRTHRVELCSDFVHLPIRLVDAKNFTTQAKPHGIDKLRRGERLDTYGGFDGFLETLAIGKRSDRTSMSVHAKSRQLVKVKKVDPDESIYAPTWRQSQAYEPGAPITRVELRFSGKGLRFVSKNGSVDLTDPAMLVDHDALARVWSSETHRRRLVRGRASRKYRDRVDPRWRVVQEAAGIEPARLRQDRSVQRRTWEELLRTCERRLIREAQTLADLHGVRTSNVSVLQSVAAMGVADGASHVSPRQLDERTRLLRARHVFVEPEADAARAIFIARMYGSDSGPANDQ